MKRRELIKYTAYATGAAVCTPLLSTILSGCSTEGVENKSDYVPAFFSQDEFSLVKELIDIILPATDSPAASEVGVHKIIDKLVSEAYRPDELEGYKLRFSAFVDYLSKSNFSDLNSNEKKSFLNEIDQSAGEDARSGFLELKQQTVAFYLSTEKIAKTYLNYLPVPGEYEACITVESVGNKAWAI